MSTPPTVDLESCHLYLLFTPDACRRDPLDVLAAALDGGVDLVQWRAKDPGRARVADGTFARSLELCATCGVPVIINDDVELAAATPTVAGAHIGQGDLAAGEARRLLRPEQRLGVSTHDHTEIDAALAAGADHLGFGPMFPTTTKGYLAGQPVGALRNALQRAGLPVFAIGGIRADNVATLVAQGCRRAAVSAAILQADDPHAAAVALRAGLLA